jgi:hypothetical protein
MRLSLCLCVSVVSNISAYFFGGIVNRSDNIGDMWNTTKHRTRVLGLLCLLMIITYLDAAPDWSLALG